MIEDESEKRFKQLIVGLGIATPEEVQKPGYLETIEQGYEGDFKRTEERIRELMSVHRANRKWEERGIKRIIDRTIDVLVYKGYGSVRIREIIEKGIDKRKYSKKGKERVYEALERKLN